MILAKFTEKFVNVMKNMYLCNVYLCYQGFIPGLIRG